MSLVPTHPPFELGAGPQFPCLAALWFQYGTPAIGFLFLLVCLLVCLRVWGFGVRHYVSTGS